MYFKFIKISFLVTLFTSMYPLSILSYDPSYTNRNNELPNEIADMKVIEKNGNTINLDLKFKNERGDIITLRDYLLNLIDLFFLQLFTIDVQHCVISI